MELTLAQKAIGFALSGEWEKAIKVNQEILKENPKDTDALNRLARAFSELGKISEAKKYANKVLEIDPVNTIASRCLKKWKEVKKVERNGCAPVLVESFLEESGKTKLITLLNLGDSSVFNSLDPGEEVKLFASAHKVSISSRDDKYLGRLPDDLAARIRNLIKTGNKYQVLIKSIEPKEVKVFIREVEKGKDSKNIPSFPPEKIDYVAFTPPELVHRQQPEVPGETEEFSE